MTDGWLMDAVQAAWDREAAEGAPPMGSYEEFEADVERLVSARGKRDRGRIWMNHLRICRPHVHAKIDGRAIDPRRHASRLPQAQDYAKEHWDDADTDR